MVARKQVHRQARLVVVGQSVRQARQQPVRGQAALRRRVGGAAEQRRLDGDHGVRRRLQRGQRIRGGRVSAANRGRRQQCPRQGSPRRLRWQPQGHGMARLARFRSQQFLRPPGRLGLGDAGLGQLEPRFAQLVQQRAPGAHARTLAGAEERLGEPHLRLARQPLLGKMLQRRVTTLRCVRVGIHGDSIPGCNRSRGASARRSAPQANGSSPSRR